MITLIPYNLLHFTQKRKAGFSISFFICTLEKCNKTFSVKHYGRQSAHCSNVFDVGSGQSKPYSWETTTDVLSKPASQPMHSDLLILECLSLQCGSVEWGAPTRLIWVGVYGTDGILWPVLLTDGNYFKCYCLEASDCRDLVNSPQNQIKH